MISRCLCLLLITGPCVSVMLDFDNFRVMHNYKRIGEISLCVWIHPAVVHHHSLALTSARRPFLLSNILFLIFHLLFFLSIFFLSYVSCLLY